MHPRLFLLLAILATPYPALADNDHEMEAIWNKHKKAFEQLSRHNISGSISSSAPLPKQKNTKSTAAAPRKSVASSGSQAAPASDAPQDDKEYTFKADTVWAVLTIHVTDKHGSYKVVGECDSPVSGWLLKTKSKTQVGKGALNEQRTFAFTINEPFTQDLELTVYVTKEGFTNPALIPLY